MPFALIATPGALGGLLFGYGAGVISGAPTFIGDVFHLSPTTQGVVAAVALGGAMIGAASAPRDGSPGTAWCSSQTGKIT